MGITDFSLTLLDRYLPTVTNKTVIELGSQNIYAALYPDYPYANKYYTKHEFMYTCIDLNGENNSKTLDLSKPLNIGAFGVVTDFGTSEHVGSNGKHDPKAFYHCWLNKHDMCEVGGLIISENPKSGNWIGHGFNYITMEFYEDLAIANGYDILELGEHAAIGNTTDGWNIYCVLRKKSNKFMTYKQFKKLKFTSL